MFSPMKITSGEWNGYLAPNLNWKKNGKQLQLDNLSQDRNVLADFVTQWHYDCPRTSMKYAVPALPGRTDTRGQHSPLILSGVKNKAITLSALIIDAAARLQGGKGNLAQICSLLRMSQFVDQVSVLILRCLVEQLTIVSISSKEPYACLVSFTRTSLTESVE